VAALAGLTFAGVSTYDFVQHLDRQVHSLHCSFIPGASATGQATGCHAAMMSSYSSVFRTSIWGGIPISLAAMSVFAFILFYAVDLLLTRRKDDPRSTAFLALATLLPTLTSALMLTISLTKLDAVCKLCAGVYISSAVSLLGAVMMWRRAIALRENRAARRGGDIALGSEVMVPPASNAFLAAMFGIGVVFVAVPIVAYVAMAPDHGKFIGTCGQLEKPADTYGVMVPVQGGGSASALEILDPLCPACKAFEQRLQSSGLAGSLDRRAILFPLDTTCNWMITENTHPGACVVSEAVLCAGDKAPEVIRWAFEVQDTVREQTKRDPTAAERIVKQRFPELAACVGSPESKSRLNKSLRWAVANNIRVLTPQLFVNNVKLCDEDVDIGLDYALSRMVHLPAPPPVVETKPAERPAVAAPLEATPPTTAAPPLPTAQEGTEDTKPAQPAETGPVTSPTAEPTSESPAPAPAETPPPPPSAPPAEPAGSNEGGAP
jgi:uncharacterized membrane protein